jgi:hypothetical protein
MRSVRWALVTIGSASVAMGGPPGDYGDAPVADNGFGVEAYPGVTARWPTSFFHHTTVFFPYHDQGTWLNATPDFYLGEIPPPVRFDSDMLPGNPENDCKPVILLYTNPLNMGTNPLADIEVSLTASFAHDQNDPLYLNIWIDQNRDGQWKDGHHLGTSLGAWTLEWAVQDVPVQVPAGQTIRAHVSGVRLELPTQQVWLRVTLSDEPVGQALRGPTGAASMFWDASMIAAHPWNGEVEDALLNYHASTPGFTLEQGIFHKANYNFLSPGPGARKAVCSVHFRGMDRLGAGFLNGPYSRQTLFCPFIDVIKLFFRYDSRNGGCTTAPNVAIGLYGPQWVDGVVGPPTIAWHQPTPGNTNIAGVLCPADAGGNWIPLAPFLRNKGPLFLSQLVAVNDLDPSRVFIDVCYPNPPRRYRKYRFFVDVMSCGSTHAGLSVEPGPESGVTLAAASTGNTFGESVDYVDVWAGGLVEVFEDLAEGRPFPDPDFSNLTFSAIGPGSVHSLDPSVFNSPPFSLHLHNRLYRVPPSIPTGLAVRAVSFYHAGNIPQLRLIDGQGASLVHTYPPGPIVFSQSRVEIPAGFDLRTIEVRGIEGYIDDLELELYDPNAPVPCDPDMDQNGAIDQDDVLYLINVVGGGENPTGRDPDFDQNGNIDQDDVTALIHVVAGGDCP